jgi:hypothetical protein
VQKCTQPCTYRQQEKLPQLTSSVAHVCATTTGLLLITDRLGEWQFLVDTGSDLCVYPRRLISRRKECVSYDLYAPNGNTIHTDGWLPVSLNLGLCRDFISLFVVADVTHPLIGVDFLSHVGLLVDCKHSCLLDGVTSLSVPAQAASSLIPSIKTINGRTPVNKHPSRRIPGPHSPRQSPV